VRSKRLAQWGWRAPACGLLLSASPALAQTLADTTSTSRPPAISSDCIVAYTFANDAPFRTDYYFTQGMSLTVVLPGLRRLPTQWLLLRNSLSSAVSHYGVQVVYDGFTPLRIQDAGIRYGDRPYASYIYATFFHAQSSWARHRRLQAGLQLGLIGPAAGAKGFQTKVHEWLAAPKPLGWDYQVRNDLVLGYEVSGEQQLAALGTAVELVGLAEAALSTLRSYAGMGLLLRLGYQTPYFATLLGLASAPNRGPLRQFQLYTELRTEAQAVAYDATLQGGLLNHRSPYTLGAGAISRGVLRGSGAVVLAYGGFSLRTVAGWITPEFHGDRPHAWGQLDLRAAF
jgi:lipid A 3-O-deacylase